MPAALGYSYAISDDYPRFPFTGANHADEVATRLEATPGRTGSRRPEPRGARSVDWLPSGRRLTHEGVRESEEPMARYTGGCLCGAVRYSIDAEPLPGRQLLCHCVDCQKQTGTAFVSGMAFPADGVTITGTMTTFTMSGGQSGEPMHRRFCTKCG